MNGLTGIVADLYNAFEPDIKITSAEGKFFKADGSFIKSINAVNGVRLVSKTLSDKALIKNGERQSLVTVRGIDQQFNKITKIDSAIVEGNFTLNDSERPTILLGRGIANQLEVSVASFANELSLFSPRRGKSESLNPMDNMNQVYCSASGIFSLNDELDFSFVFVNLETAKKLFETPDRVSSLEISCEEGQKEKVQRVLQEKLGSGYVVKNRYQLNDTLFKSLETEKLATFIILAFILVIATFNIIGALTMLIIEKKKDIKTLHSMGADLQLIRRIFMREGFLISGIGAVLGLLLGLFVCWLQVTFHLVTFGEDFIIPYYPIVMQLKDFIWIFGLIMLISFLAALYPIRVFTNTDLVHGAS